jgi:hypothetical protein
MKMKNLMFLAARKSWVSSFPGLLFVTVMGSALFLAVRPAAADSLPQSDHLIVWYIGQAANLTFTEAYLTENRDGSDQNSGIATFTITTPDNDYYDAGTGRAVLVDPDGTFSDSVTVQISLPYWSLLPLGYWRDLTFTLTSDNGLGAPAQGIAETGDPQDITALLFPVITSLSVGDRFNFPINHVDVQSDVDVPEPGSLGLLGLGLVVLVGRRNRKGTARSAG